MVAFSCGYTYHLLNLALARLVPTERAFAIPKARYTEEAVSGDMPLDRLDTFLAECGEPLNHYGPTVNGSLPCANLLAKDTTERRNSLSRDVDPHLRGQTRIVHMTRSLLEYAQCTTKGETRSNTS